MCIHDRVRLMLSLDMVGKSLCTRLILSLIRMGKEWADPVFPHPLKIKRWMCIRDRVKLMLSLVRVGNEWTSRDFLNPDNHLHTVDALSCQGGERMGRPSFSPPLKSKGCLHIHDRVRLILLLVGVGKEWANPVFLHPDNLASAQDWYFHYTSQGGERIGRPIFPHPLKSKRCMCIHDMTG